jgi:hypothetical protein
VLALLVAAGAHALEYHLIFQGTWDYVTEHGICRSVSNNGGGTIYVPTLYAEEWGSFVGNKPPQISIGA